MMNLSIHSEIFNSSFGLFSLTTEGPYIRSLDFIKKDEFLSQKTSSPLIWREDFFYEPHLFSLKPKGTEFQLKIWDLVKTIPLGKTLCYKEIALLYEIKYKNSSFVRAVASAIAKNPIAFLIPCHRVIYKSGKYGSYKWGANKKNKLLKWEYDRVSQP